jgi:catechol 2,3-dioxygenase-like lactoylglutathione lyase family enzyme
MIHGVDLVRVPVPCGREAEARAFYGAVLGFRELDRTLDEGVRFVLPDGRELFCDATPAFRPDRRSLPTFAVQDLEVLADTLGRAGYRAEWDFSTSRPRFYCLDPFANRLQFVPEQA